MRSGQVLNYQDLIDYLHQPNPAFSIGPYGVFWNKTNDIVNLFKLGNQPLAIEATGQCQNWMQALGSVFNVIAGYKPTGGVSGGSTVRRVSRVRAGGTTGGGTTRRARARRVPISSSPVGTSSA
jgi:hypothetical protein